MAQCVSSSGHPTSETEGMGECRPPVPQGRRNVSLVIVVIPTRTPQRLAIMVVVVTTMVNVQGSQEATAGQQTYSQGEKT
jgi:hypothetical protein